MVFGLDPGGASLLQGATRLVTYMLGPEVLGPAGPFIVLGEAAYGMIARQFGLPDPMDLLFSQFSGRPTMEATLDQAKILRRYSSPALKFLALGAAQLVHSNIPISSHDAGPIIGPYFEAAQWVEQGIRWGRLDPHVAQIEANTLRVALHEAGNPGHAQPVTLEAIDKAYHDWQNGRAQGGGNPTEFFQQHVQHLGKTPEEELIKGWWSHHMPQPEQPTPPPPPVHPPAPQLAQDFHPYKRPWFPICNDRIDCNAVSDGDLASSQQLGNIAKALVTLPYLFAELPESQIGKSLITTLQTIQLSLHNIHLRMSPTASMPMLVNAVDCVCKELQAVNATLGRDETAEAKAINQAAAEIAKAADTSKIAAALNEANKQRDIPHAMIQQFLHDKVLPPQMSGLLQGTPADWVHAALGYAAILFPTVDWAEHLLGDDKDFEAAARSIREGVKIGSAKALATIKDISKKATRATAEPLAEVFKGILTIDDSLFYPIVKPGVEAISSLLKPKASGCPPLGHIGVDGAHVVSTAVGVALTAGVGAWLAAFAGVDEGEPLAHIAEILAGAVGFEELKDVEIRPLVTHGIERIANLEALRMFRQEIPGFAAGYGLAARGLITRAEADKLAAYNGLTCELEAAEASAAYGGLNARMFLRLADTGLYSNAEIRDELTFSGLRPASQERMLRAVPYLSSDPERKQLRAELEKAAGAGVISIAELKTRLAAAEHETDREALIEARVSLEIEQNSIKDLEREYSTLYLAGLITPTTYHADLVGLGLQSWKVNNLLAVAEAKAAANLARQEAAAARALARETAAAERKAAMANYAAGRVPAPALAAALIATGLTPVQAAAWTDLAAVRKTGLPHRLYGLELDPAAATLLTERIAAIKDQRKKGFLTDAQMVKDLQTLGLAPHYVNAVQAAVDATLTGKGAAHPIPIETAA